MTQSLKSIVPLTLALGALLAYQFMGAAAPANPPNNNVPAPVNIGVDQTSSQIIQGALGVDDLGVFSDLSFTFKNTADNNSSGWVVRGNDGAGNYNNYLNTTGGSAPTFMSTGYAFRQRYNPGSGEVLYQVSDSSGSAGQAFTWMDALSIFPNGSVGSDQICDSNGANCFTPADVGASPGTVSIQSCFGTENSNVASCAVSCPAGTVRTGCSATAGNADAAMSVAPSGSNACSCGQFQPDTGTISCYAYCLTP